LVMTKRKKRMSLSMYVLLTSWRSSGSRSGKKEKVRRLVGKENQGLCLWNWKERLTSAKGRERKRVEFSGRDEKEVRDRGTETVHEKGPVNVNELKRSAST